MYSIVTDTSANLEPEVIQSFDMTVIPFNYYIDSNEQTCLDIKAFDGAAYYASIRAGARVTTSQVTPQRYIEYMKPLLDAGSDVLFVGMSSGVSGSYSSAEAAAAELRELYPERRIRLVDTLGASLGEGLLAIKAGELRQAGKSIDEAADELIRLRMRMCQIFTVDDIMHLRRTGRLSNLTAVIGAVLHIKPLLKGDREGKIVCFQKVRGRRSAIKAIAQSYARLVVSPDSQTVGIAHAGCIEDAELLKSLISELAPPKQIMTVCYEPVTGSHVGPGALALFFLGSDRDF